MQQSKRLRPYLAGAALLAVLIALFWHSRVTSSTDFLLSEIDGQPTPSNIDFLVDVTAGTTHSDEQLSQSDIAHVIRFLREKTTSPEDLTKTLAYEMERAQRPANLSKLELDELDTNDERNYTRTNRDYALRRLHSREARDFVLRTGSGFSRHQPPGVESLEIDDFTLIPIDQTQPAARGSRISLPSHGDLDSNQASLPSIAKLEGMHSNSRDDFAAARNGFEQAGKRIGFSRHAVTESVSSHLHDSHGWHSETKSQKHGKWNVNQMHLVSLLQFDEPRAYVSFYMPSMEDLKNRPTRDLSDFESKALAKLYEGEDLITEAHTNEILMLGSLRASKACLECHNVQRGELLGAFSYKLVRLAAETDQKVTQR